MFYEPFSDFFYDPKTKFYYGNAKKKYFKYDADAEDGKGAFRPIGGEEGGESDAVSGVVTAAAGEESMKNVTPTPASAVESKPEKVELKPKIAISLKTTISPKDSNNNIKSLNEVAAMEKTKLQKKIVQRKESTLSAGENNAGTIHQPLKKHAKDMDKWSERVKEMRDETDAKCDVVPPPSKKIKTTTSGQPICVLCRRKFPTLEKLQQHEKLSALHKENLVKKAAKDAATAAKKKRLESSVETYRDRTKERRLMHGGSLGANPDSTSSHAEALLAHSLNNDSSVERKVAETIRPEDTLNNDANVGNKLLQKLGWKSGETLGRMNGNQNVDGMMGGNSGGGRKDDVASNLRSDWERIESLAQRGGRR
mmetsp:Transcript_24487/g.44172  ORF Transcript_24487/g.44172 Transcript_24487/m.44172 type:complete len:367 (-) Transcript_24487:166-1266(-)